MARIVVIEPDARMAQAFARLLHGSGHAAELVADEMTALADLMEHPAELVLAAAGPGGAGARRVWSALQTLEPQPAIVWTGPLRAMVLPMLDAGRGEDFVETPPSAAALSGVLSRLVGTPAAADRWSGVDFLATVDGAASRYPPARVLFLAHRVSASGTLSVGPQGGDGWTVSLKNGRIIGCTGLASVDAPSGPQPDASAPPLMAMLGQVIASGADPERAMHAAGVGIARAALRAGSDDRLHVTFAATEAPGGAMQLPGRIPRLIAEARTLERPASAVRGALGARRKEAVGIQVPDDAPESQWGLTTVALRLLRDGARVETLGELLGAARGGETDEVWEAVDLLCCLGMLRIGDGVVVRAEAAPEGEDDIEIEPLAGGAASGTGDVALDEEAAALKAWLDDGREHLHWQVLGIEDSEQMTADGVEAAFRKQSASFHPDMYLSAAPGTQALARRCFARLVEAREALEDVDVLLETRQRKRAEEDGRPYASPAEQQQGRLIARRAEVSVRKSQWAEASRLWKEACAVDGTEVSYQWNRLLAGWRAGEIDGPTAEAEMLALKSMKVGQRADLMATVGEIRLRAGDEEGAYAAFTSAVELNPDHVDARRRLRLRDMRQAKADGTKSGGLSLKGLFSFGRKGGPRDDAGSEG